MRFLTKLFFIVNFCVCFKLISQNSPQVEDFVNLGSGYVSEITGKFEREFPLCTISGYGLSSHVGLHYTSNEFRPNKEESEVGLNWFLNTGGVIVRTVKGIEDDLRDDRPKSDEPDGEMKHADGFYVGVKRYGPTKDHLYYFYRILKEEGNPDREFDYNYYTYFGDLHNRYEARPDEFDFKFNGISGKFFFDVDGTPKINCDSAEYIDIDVSGFTEQRAEPGLYDLCAPKNSEIIITLGNGYKYYFGGVPENLEWRVNFDDEGRPIRPVITAWNLSKIETPNGKKMVFEYGSLNQDLCRLNMQRKFSESENINVLPEQAVTENEIYYNNLDKRYWGDIKTTECGPNEYADTDSYILKKTKLNRINIENKRFIDFEYATNLNLEKCNTLERNCFSSKLENIRVHGVGLPEKNIHFEYQFLGGQYSRMFLHKIMTDNQEPYEFEYKKTDNLPHFRTSDYSRTGSWHIGASSSLNYFGVGCRFGEFYDHPIWKVNGVVTQTERRKRLLSTIYYGYDDNGRPIEKNKSLIKSGGGADAGLLTKIILPTKGGIEVEYYGNKVNHIKALSGDDEFSFDEILKTTRFTAPRIGPGWGPFESHIDKFFKDEIEYLKDNFNIRRGGDKRGYTVYKKQNGTYIIKLYAIINPVNGSFILNTPYRTPLRSFDDYGDFHYLPLAEILFGTDGRAISKVVNKFIEKESNELVDAAHFFDERQGVHHVFGISNKIELKRYLLKEKKTFKYKNNKELPDLFKRIYRSYNKDIEYPNVDASNLFLQSTILYNYDEFFSIKEQIESNIEGIKNIIRNTYVQDYASNTSNSIYNEMFDSKQFYPITQTTIVEKGGVEYPIAMNASMYKKEFDNVVIDKQYQWHSQGDELSLETGLSISSNGTISIIDSDNTLITTYINYNETGVAQEVFDNINNTSFTLLEATGMGSITAFSQLTEQQFNTIPFSPTALLLNQNIGFENYKVYLKNIFALDRQFHESSISLNSFNELKELVVEKNPNVNIEKSIEWLKAREFEYLQEYLAKNYPKASASFSVFDEEGLLVQQIDGRGKSIYFEYDEKKRLKIEKDHYGNIIKHYTNNY